jgi:hypothetical protein
LCVQEGGTAAAQRGRQDVTTVQPNPYTLAPVNVLNATVAGQDVVLQNLALGFFAADAVPMLNPAESPCTQSNTDPSVDSPPPVTVDADAKPNYWDVSLQEVIQLALANSPASLDNI